MTNSRDYFEILDLDTKYDIDKKLLDKKLFEKQLEYHPDKHLSSDEATKEKALEKSQLINFAYKTLKSDFSRAEHILSLQNIDIANEELDQDFLMETFQWRESLEDPSKLPALKKEVEEIIDKTMQTLGLSLEKELYENAKKDYIRLKFLKRFLEEIEKA